MVVQRQALYNPEIKLQQDALKQQKEIAEMQFNPGREFLVNLGKGFANAAGDLTVQAAKWKLFGGEEEQALAEKAQSDLYQTRGRELDLQEDAAEDARIAALRLGKQQSQTAMATRVKEEKTKAHENVRQIIKDSTLQAMSTKDQERRDFAYGKALESIEGLRGKMVPGTNVPMLDEEEYQRALAGLDGWALYAHEMGGMGLKPGTSQSIFGASWSTAHEPKASRVSVKVVNMPEAKPFDVTQVRNQMMAGWANVDELARDPEATPEDRKRAEKSAWRVSKNFDAMSKTRAAALTEKARAFQVQQGEPPTASYEGESFRDDKGNLRRPTTNEMKSKDPASGAGAGAGGGPSTGRTTRAPGRQTASRVKAVGATYLEMAQSPTLGPAKAQESYGIAKEESKTALDKLVVDYGNAGTDAQRGVILHRIGISVEQAGDPTSTSYQQTIKSAEITAQSEETARQQAETEMASGKEAEAHAVSMKQREQSLERGKTSDTLLNLHQRAKDAGKSEAYIKSRLPGLVDVLLNMSDADYEARVTGAPARP